MNGMAEFPALRRRIDEDGMGQRRIGVIGAGAMGALLGGALARVGHDVILIDVSDEVVDRINTHGVTIAGREQFTETNVRAVTPTTRMEVPCDLVFVFVKGMHTRQAIAQTGASGVWGPETTVVTLQNGWGNPDRLCAARVDPSQVVVGVSNHSATLIAPGRVEHAGVGPTLVGKWDTSTTVDRATQVAERLREVGWPVQVREDIRTEVWKKLVLNSASLPASALTGLPCAGLVENEHTCALMIAVMRETVAVGRALGFEIDSDERIEFVLDVLRNAGQGKPSMLQDFLAGRPSEIDTITGAIVDKAHEVGVAVPVNETLFRLVAGTEFARHG